MEGAASLKEASQPPPPTLVDIYLGSFTLGSHGAVIAMALSEHPLPRPCPLHHSAVILELPESLKTDSLVVC